MKKCVGKSQNIFYFQERNECVPLAAAAPNSSTVPAPDGRGVVQTTGKTVKLK
jgi:hypothetical protein